MAVCLGCSNDGEVAGTQPEPALGSAINFGGHITEISRTKAIVDSDAFPNGTEVGVFGWGHRRGTTENTTLRADLDNSKYITRSGDNTLQTDVPAHYPVNPDTLLNFYAYHPYVATAGADPLKIAFDLTQQHDLMWATPVTERDKTNENEKVDFKFNHQLSAITLVFKKADDIKEEMILQDVALENYSPSLILNVQTGILTAPAATTPFVILAEANKTITKEKATVLTNHLLCPVESPVFLVKLSNAAYRVVSKKAFLAGKKQTYEFTIQADNISISGSIAPWEDGGTSEEVIPF